MKFFLLFNALVLSKASSTDTRVKTSKFSQEKEERWKELFVQSSSGNSTAYNELLSEIADYLTLFCQRYLYSSTQVEDCVQECLLAIHKAKHTFNPQLPFAPWFYTIVRRKIVDQYRIAKKRKDREVLDTSFGELQASSEVREVGLYEGLEKLYIKLNPANREAFGMTRLQGKTIAEAAVALDISESAVKVRVYRAGKQLRKLISQEFAAKY